MLAQTTERLIDDYLSELIDRGNYARHFAEEATFAIMGTDHEAEGRSAVEQMIRYLHEEVFDATVECKNRFAAESHATLEAEFVGTHIGDFAGIAPTHRSVRVPYSVVYDVENELISALRVYMPLNALVAQMS